MPRDVIRGLGLSFRTSSLDRGDEGFRVSHDSNSLSVCSERCRGDSSVNEAAAFEEAPITPVQSDYSLWSRDPEQQLPPLLQELGIDLVAYSRLGHGSLTGAIGSLDDLDDNDWRSTRCRYRGENFSLNLRHRRRSRRRCRRNRGNAPARAPSRGCSPKVTTLSQSLAPGASPASRRTPQPTPLRSRASRSSD